MPLQATQARSLTAGPTSGREIRQFIVHEALRHEHKPYADQAWGPTYFDCIGFVGYVGLKLGLLYFEEGCEEGKKFRAYSQDASVGLQKEALDTFLVRLPSKRDAEIGDIFWFRDPNPRHLGIIVRVNPYYIIHASRDCRSNLRRNGEVILQRLSDRDGTYVVAAWRYPKLQEAINVNK